MTLAVISVSYGAAREPCPTSRGDHREAAAPSVVLSGARHLTGTPEGAGEILRCAQDDNRGAWRDGSSGEEDMGSGRDDISSLTRMTHDG